MRCVICRKKNAKACDQCKSIHYCSKECQKRDWRIHKVFCLPMAQMPPRPSEKHQLAFFFPESEQLPQLVWIKVLPLERCFDCRDPFCMMICEPHLRSYFGAEPTLRGLDDNEYMDRTNNYIYISGMDVCVNPRNGARSSSHGLRLTGLANSYRSNIPLSLGALAREFRMSWRGPMVVQRQKHHKNGMCQVATDVTLADLRLLVDYASAPPHLFPNPTTMDDSGDEDD